MPFLLIALLVVPFLELYFIIQVGREIGVLPTIALLILDSVLGAWLVRREGRRAWQALNQSFGAGKVPTRELVDGALILIGGTLLLTPGFATDIVGFFLLLPFTRPLARRALVGFASRRFTAAVVGTQPRRTGRTAPGHTAPGHTTTPGGGKPRGGRVVSGEVVEDDPDRC
ncbi:MAG: FxsA family protein [Sporichthyaceae bacterium]